MPPPGIYPLSLHDALPISHLDARGHQLLDQPQGGRLAHVVGAGLEGQAPDRHRSEETRLNSSHEWISYAVFGVKKKITFYNIEGHQYNYESNVKCSRSTDE